MKIWIEGRHFHMVTEGEEDRMLLERIVQDSVKGCLNSHTYSVFDNEKHCWSKDKHWKLEGCII